MRSDAKMLEKLCVTSYANATANTTVQMRSLNDVRRLTATSPVQCPFCRREKLRPRLMPMVHADNAVMISATAMRLNTVSTADSF